MKQAVHPNLVRCQQALLLLLLLLLLICNVGITQDS
jgi:hypothetical protein